MGENTISCFNKNNLLKEFPLPSSSNEFFVYQNILFSNTEYFIAWKNQVYSYPILKTKNILGIHGKELFFTKDNKVNRVELDFDFINWQKSALLQEPLPIQKSFRSKAIRFYESMGKFEEALKICDNSNQKFDILIKLNKLEEAKELANSPAKLIKLGKAFPKRYQLKRSAERL